MKQAKEKKIIVSFRIEQSLINKLKRVAREQSVREDRDVSFAAIIRDLIKERVEDE